MPALFKLSHFANGNRGSRSASTLVLRYRLSAGLEYQIGLLKFLVLEQNQATIIANEWLIQGTMIRSWDKNLHGKL